MKGLKKFYKRSRILASSRQGMVVLLYSKVLSWILLNSFRGKSAVHLEANQLFNMILYGCILPTFTLKPDQIGLFGQPENWEGVGGIVGGWGVGGWIKTKDLSPQIVT